MDAAGNGAAADESDDTATAADQSSGTVADESNRAGYGATGAERHDGTSWVAAGTGAEADRAFVSAGHVHRLHEAEEPSLEPDCAVYANECSFAASDKYGPAEVAVAG